MIRILRKIFPRKPAPLVLWRLPWKAANIGSIKNLALGIDACTRSGGLYGISTKGVDR